jgi:hypothetical protein
MFLLPLPRFDAQDLRLAWYNSWAATRGRAGIVLWRQQLHPGSDVVMFTPAEANAN